MIVLVVVTCLVRAPGMPFPVLGRDLGSLDVDVFGIVLMSRVLDVVPLVVRPPRNLRFRVVVVPVVWNVSL